MIRLHVPQPLSAGAAVLPTLDQSRYLTQVMRLKAGDGLRVFNGVDGEWRCAVAAARIGLVTTRRTQGDRVRMDRLEAIATESAEQTGRLDVPAIDLAEKLEALLDGWDGSRRLMFCDETGGEPAMTALAEAGGGPWAILIGPEGGFAPEERERLRALPFTTAVSLGPRVLRADTAATAALTLWQAAIGDWER